MTECESSDGLDENSGIQKMSAYTSNTRDRIWRETGVLGAGFGTA